MATTISVWEEHLFWLEILQDHAIFVRDHLSVEEEKEITAAKSFIQSFGTVLNQLRQMNPALGFSSTQMTAFAKRAYSVAYEYFLFEGHLQNLRIKNQINLNLSPTYLNGTLNENQEYLRLLSYQSNGQQPVPLKLDELLDLWLEDQLGHIILLRNLIDPIELAVDRQTNAYAQKFQMFILQNHHIKGFLRFTEQGFPRQKELALEVGRTVIEMNLYIRSVVEKYNGERILNKTTLRFLEHHFPETCYFIKKLAEFAPELHAESTNCSLRKPSFS
ncbi:DUF2935 domain-containing protein [Neobacillus sp. MM2021_6]|uniref:DUF2935 domain-containing protein n=1 Tax=Bacillaceae TaxID=186817 RepID=UPI00140A876D|nr:MULTISPECIES: DUF2935 domain-containing protein [Bacillaceae]MBO0962926.1 DUF2935 domain-containing protein [Neobacillus sp. MM2021_6]NHC19995.1 DUF2935 domain-containing protein [Bacillus sp. MM2020_4]